ncbi:hypothetical protein TI04_04500 [Achromatium sp. WMS2]|nr:hypothetical protein TI04_04500 [Achromatium sp. WMS2]
MPNAIELHQKSRILSIKFNDGNRFDLPCEYLRVFSKAAEVRTMTEPVVGKETVNITAIEPQGQYGIRIIFDDGHDTSIYSWDTLYQLGTNYQQNWQAYLKKIQDYGYTRQLPTATRRIKILYFAHLAQKLRLETETLELPPTVTDISTLLHLLSLRKPGAAPLFASNQLRITVNRQFAEGLTRLDDGDEVALVPNSPILPPTPDLI